MSMRGGMWWAGRLSIVLIVLLAAGWGLQHDARPANASHTEILVSDLYTSIHKVDSTVLMVGGPTKYYYVWAKNVDNSTGASAFKVHVNYNSHIAALTTLLPQTGWLASTGRSVSCQQTTINPNPQTGAGEGFVSCNTFLPPPPYGPKCPNQCNGWLGTIAISPMTTVGFTVFDLSLSQLVDTPPNPENQIEIPATVSSLAVNVAPCADFPVPVKDGTVRVSDILYIVQRYRSTDMTADMNADGQILVADILIAVREFFQNCP